jgi:hypothetical protein
MGQVPHLLILMSTKRGYLDKITLESEKSVRVQDIDYERFPF